MSNQPKIQSWQSLSKNNDPYTTWYSNPMKSNLYRVENMIWTSQELVSRTEDHRTDSQSESDNRKGTREAQTDHRTTKESRIIRKQQPGGSPETGRGSARVTGDSLMVVTGRWVMIRCSHDGEPRAVEDRVKGLQGFRSLGKRVQQYKDWVWVSDAIETISSINHMISNQI